MSHQSLNKQKTFKYKQMLMKVKALPAKVFGVSSTSFRIGLPKSSQPEDGDTDMTVESTVLPTILSVDDLKIRWKKLLKMPSEVDATASSAISSG